MSKRALLLPLFLAAALLTACFEGESASSQVLLATPQGVVKGLQQDDISVFKGLPYAQPPLGELAGQKPLTLRNWQESVDATAFADIQGEDRLYLNVYTAAEQGAKAPVLCLLLPDDADAAAALYDGAVFAQSGIVVVTAQLRLPTGSFSAAALAQDRIAMADLKELLNYLALNIDAFGGDAANITLAGSGQSACAVAAALYQEQLAPKFAKALLFDAGFYAANAQSAASEDSWQEIAGQIAVKPLIIGYDSNLGAALLPEAPAGGAAALAAQLFGRGKADQLLALLPQQDELTACQSLLTELDRQGVVALAEQAQQAGCPVYLYELDYAHCGTLGLLWQGGIAKDDADALNLSEHMGALWVNFISCGDPNEGIKLNGQVKWPLYAPQEKNCLLRFNGYWGEGEIKNADILRLYDDMIKQLP